MFEVGVLRRVAQGARGARGKEVCMNTTLREPCFHDLRSRQLMCRIKRGRRTRKHAYPGGRRAELKRGVVA